MLQAVGRMVCTWRAPSSPHLACGLNVSLFCTPCSCFSAGPAGVALALLWVKKPANPCEGGLFLRGLL